MPQKTDVNGTDNTPNKWFYQKQWLRVFDHDQGMAEDIRHCLSCPESDLRSDEGFNTWEANTRAALHEIIDNLDRNGLMPVFEAARLFLLFPLH